MLFKGAWNDLEHIPDSRETSCAIVGATIYVFGGQGDAGALDTVYAYDIDGDVWSASPLSPLPQPSSGHTSVALGTDIFVFGGSVGAAWKYDTAADSWSVVASPSSTLYGAACECAGKIYYFGGLLDNGYTTASTQIYDPGGDSWSTGAGMPESRAGAFCEVVDGKIYLIGGYHNPEGGPVDSYTNTCFLYDPISDSWTIREPMERPRAYGASGVAKGRIIILGGFEGVYPGLTVTESYNPTWNSWRSLNDEPFARSFTCGASYGSRVFVLGGKIDTTVYTSKVREFIAP